MRRHSLARNMMLGFALAALGCAGSNSHHRYNRPDTAYQYYGNSSTTSSTTDDYSPPPVESSPQEYIEELDSRSPAEMQESNPNEIPPPPSFDQGGFLAPPKKDRDPLTASNSSGLRRLRVPLKLQPIHWHPLRSRDDEPVETPQVYREVRFGHSLQAQQ